MPHTARPVSLRTVGQPEVCSLVVRTGNAPLAPPETKDIATKFGNSTRLLWISA
jgi:hypothetical protein